ncbi:MAG: zf-HC2 domain-containing protein [Bacillota bacterium]
MDCRKVSGLLSPYLDGELEPSEKNIVSSHLKSCSACRRELAELQAAVQIFRQLPELAPGPAFRPRLRERLARESRSLPAGVSGSPAAFPIGGQALPSAPRFPVDKAPATHSAESREVPRWVGLRAVSGLFRSGARLWPKLAVATILLLAMGITSLWYGLAGPGLVPKLPVERLAGLPSQPKYEEVRGGRAEPAGSPERKASDAAGDDLSVVSSPEAGRPGLLASAPQGVPAPEQAPEDGQSASKKYPAETGHALAEQKENQKDNAGRQKIFLTAPPAPSESTPEPAAAAAAAREKENPADPGAAPKEVKPAAFPVGQGKGYRRRWGNCRRNVGRPGSPAQKIGPAGEN